MDIAKGVLNGFFEDCFYNILKHEQTDICQMGELSLSISEIHLISAVARSKNANGSNISKRLKITAGSLTVAVNTLIAKGYLVKKRDIADKRILRLSLTDEGKRVARLHDMYHEKLMETVTNGLSTKQTGELIAALDKIKSFTELE